ncbi:MAG TPA: hypothetical protein VHX15_00075 [Frankiaceae bacterium]|jgi:hypothetical protein|nr:hypothetical protein [Frankiaceae bacterium]
MTGLAVTAAGLVVATACSTVAQTAPKDSADNIGCSSLRKIPTISVTVLLHNSLAAHYLQIHTGQAVAVSLTSAEGDLDVPHADHPEIVCQATTTPTGPQRTVTFVATDLGKTGFETTTTHHGRDIPLYWAGVTVTAQTGAASDSAQP